MQSFWVFGGAVVWQPATVAVRSVAVNGPRVDGKPPLIWRRVSGLSWSSFLGSAFFMARRRCTSQTWRKRLISRSRARLNVYW